MSDATSGVVEDLLEHKFSHGDEKWEDVSGDACKEQREKEKKVQEEILKVLNPEDFISKPILSKKCTMPDDVLVFQYPFLFRLDIIHCIYEHISQYCLIFVKNKLVCSFLK